MLNSLKADLTDEKARERLERATSLLRATSPTGSRNSAVHLSVSSSSLAGDAAAASVADTGVSPAMSRTSSTSSFLRRISSFARLHPPQPPPVAPSEASKKVSACCVLIGGAGS